MRQHLISIPVRIGRCPVGGGSLDGNEIFQMRMLQLDSDILARPPVCGSVNLGELEIFGPSALEVVAE